MSWPSAQQRKSYLNGFALADWSANSPSSSSARIPRCKPRLIAFTRSIWRRSANGGLTQPRKRIDYLRRGILWRSHALDETNSGAPTFIWTDLPAMPLRMGLTVFGGLARGP